MGSEKISICDDDMNGELGYTKPGDSIVLDMEAFHHPLEKDVTTNSRIYKLQRSLSRKGSLRGVERKSISKAANEIPIEPRAAVALHDEAANKLEKLTVVTAVATENSAPQAHSQIPITATAAQSKLGAKRFSFRRRPSSSPSWAIDPRRILIFFATLSSMGTMLLIYFTLSMDNKVNDLS